MLLRARSLVTGPLRRPDTLPTRAVWPPTRHFLIDSPLSARDWAAADGLPAGGQTDTQMER